MQNKEILVSQDAIKILSEDQVINSELSGLKSVRNYFVEHADDSPKDVVYFKNDLIHSEANLKGCKFDYEDIEERFASLKSKPVKYEHNRPILGTITDVFVTGNEKDGWVLTTAGVLWANEEPQLVTDIVNGILSDPPVFKTSMEVIYKDFNAFIGDESISKEDFNNIKEYAGKNFNGKKVTFTPKNFTLSGAGIVRYPANPEATFKQISLNDKIEAPEDVLVAGMNDENDKGYALYCSIVNELQGDNMSENKNNVEKIDDDSSNNQMENKLKTIFANTEDIYKELEPYFDDINDELKEAIVTASNNILNYVNKEKASTDFNETFNQIKEDVLVCDSLNALDYTIKDIVYSKVENQEELLAKAVKDFYANIADKLKKWAANASVEVVEVTDEEKEEAANVSNKSWGDVSKKELPSSCFLYVGDKDKKTTWMFPVYEGAGSKDESGMYTKKGALNANAVAAAATYISKTKDPAIKKQVASKLKNIYKNVLNKEVPPNVDKCAASYTTADVYMDVYDTLVDDVEAYSLITQKLSVYADLESKLPTYMQIEEQYGSIEGITKMSEELDVLKQQLADKEAEVAGLLEEKDNEIASLNQKINEYVVKERTDERMKVIASLKLDARNIDSAKITEKLLAATDEDFASLIECFSEIPESSATVETEVPKTEEVTNESVAALDAEKTEEVNTGHKFTKEFSAIMDKGRRA